MRIGFDATPLCTSRSGVGTYTGNLLENMRRLSDDEILPLAHYLSDDIRFDNRDTPSIAPSGKRKLRLNKTLWMQAVLPWLLLRLRADVCHFTNGVGSFWTPCPTVVTIHDLTLWMFPEYHYRRRLLAMRPFISLAVRRAAAIIAVSQATKADIIRTFGIEESKIHVIYEAASPLFRPLTSNLDLEIVRRRYGLPERYLLYVGTIEPRKNLVRLLAAFARLRNSTGFNHSLVFVGDRGWKDEAVFAAIERLELGKAVRFLGYVPTTDLVAVYNLAGALAFPSLYEGFGLPVVEAMACGTPVLTSPNGSLREVAGTAAEFVDPLEVDSIAAGLRRILLDSDRRQELRTGGLAQAARFTWQKSAQETLALYKEICAASNR